MKGHFLFHFTYILYFGALFASYGQQIENKTITSLQEWYEAGLYYTRNGRNLDSALYFIKASAPLVADRKDKAAAQYYDLVGKYHLQGSTLDSARVAFGNSLRLYEALNDIEGQAQMHNSLSVVAVRQSDYKTGIQEARKSLQLAEKLGDSLSLFPQQYNIGMLYIYIKHYDRAKQYHRQGFQNALHLGDSIWASRISGALCNVFLKEKKADSAAHYLEQLKAFKNHQLAPYDNYWFFKGQLALVQEEYASAVAYFERSLEQETTSPALTYTRIALAYLHQDLPKKTLYFLNRADTLLQGAKPNFMTTSRDSLYYEAHSQLGNTSLAQDYFKKYQKGVATNLSLKKVYAVNEAEQIFEIDQREKVIENQEKALQRSSSKNLILSLSLVILSLVFGWIVFKSIKKRKRLQVEKAYIDEQYRRANAKNLALTERLQEVSAALNQRALQKGTPRYERSSLTPERQEEYMDQLLHYMEREEPFLDAELTQGELAKKLSLTSHHLSEILNVKLGKNFYGFVNLYRVEAAKRILENDTENLTMLAVAYDSGFNSKASFNRVFKQLMGMTPSEYKMEKSASFS